MTRPEPQDGRAAELLADRALEGLDDAALAELEALGASGDASFDLAAAAVALSALPDEPMPAALGDKVMAAWSAAHADAGVTPLPVGLGSRPRRRLHSVTQVAWLALAACLVATLATWTLRHPRTTVVYIEPPPPRPATPPSPVQQRGLLLHDEPDALTLPLRATADPAARGAGGDVVWSEARQLGFMRFVGVTPNDHQRYQFQLWIFDGERDARYPVDGGVFDVPSSGEVVVPITARLHVARPTLFAITVEKPGGVVVSARERIVLTAAPAPPAPGSGPPPPVPARPSRTPG